MSAFASLHSLFLRTRRAAARLTVLGVTAAAVPTALVVTAPSADAAWTTASKAHGGKVQLCKVHQSGDLYKIRMRLDNRNAEHRHIGGVSNVKNFKVVESAEVRPAAGKISQSRSITWRTRWEGDDQWISAGIGETNGQGHGGAVSFSSIPNC